MMLIKLKVKKEANAIGKVNIINKIPNPGLHIPDGVSSSRVWNTTKPEPNTRVHKIEFFIYGFNLFIKY